MKKSMLLSAFMLSAFVWAGAQQTTSPAAPDAQSTAPAASQSQTVPAAPDQTAPSATPQAGASGQAMDANVTQGCLGGSNPNFTITDSKGTTYKLNLPAGANGATLTSHVGESVAVSGSVSSDSIAVTKIGRGTTTCTK